MILHPAKATLPLVVDLGLAVQDSVAPLPGWVLMDRVTEALEVVTVLPPLSSMATTGWVPQVRAGGPAAGLGGEAELCRRADGDGQVVRVGAG